MSRHWRGCPECEKDGDREAAGPLSKPAGKTPRGEDPPGQARLLSFALSLSQGLFSVYCVKESHRSKWNADPNGCAFYRLWGPKRLARGRRETLFAARKPSPERQ